MEKEIEFDQNSKLIFSHENLKKINAVARRDKASDYRTDVVAIIDNENFFLHIFPSASEINKRLENYFIENANPINLLGVAKAHLEFISIHPFLNGNGRTARFITDVQLCSLGYEPFMNFDIDRSFYYRSVRCYLQTGDLNPMSEFLIKYSKLSPCST